ncbi:MFS transporter [Brevibacillus sp. NRS-1366]|uniref:MFS transporter n=1 Tax=Brevibacillus sp. NRS-1366 TaxID=3233899 RepID=UPI003D2407A2
METEKSERNKTILIRILMLTLTISSMSALMFNIVLPEISKEFDLTISSVSWLSTAYGLIYAIGTVTYGKLADSYKLKNLLTFGLLVFAVGSFLGLASQSFSMALIGRCLQAVGASAIPATAMLIPVRYFPPEHRGAVLGMTAVGLALGGALGPVLAALIVSFAHWRWLFSVPLLILVTLPLYRKYLEDEESLTHRKFDWMGGGLLAVAVTSLLMGVTNGSWWFVLGSLLALSLFIVRIRMVSEPFVQPKIFANKRYTLGLAMAVLVNGIGVSLYFLSPLLLSSVQQLSTHWIGFVMVPAAIASAILGRMGGRLADLKGNTYLFFVASGLLLTCFGLLSTFTGISVVGIAIFLIFGNVGQSFMQITMANSISRTLSKEQAGVGMGIFSMLNFISMGIASAIYSKVIDLGATTHWNPVNPYPAGLIYSNIYLVLTFLHAGIILFYYFQFGKSRGVSLQANV